MSRRGLGRVLALGAAAGVLGKPVRGQESGDVAYRVPGFGNVRLLHFTDCHAQVLPVHFPEPNVNCGMGPALGMPPHLVGKAFLDRFDLPHDGRQAHAFSHLNFEAAARRYGKVGGFPHLGTLINRLRGEYARGKTLSLDGGDMVRMDGLDYVCNPTESIGKRISAMTLDDGAALEADKQYKVAGWATVGSKSPGPPIWEVVSEYLRAENVAKVAKLDTPKFVNVRGNPGVADYSGQLE